MTSRQIVWTIAPLVLAYGAWLVPHAWQELTEDYHVQGLERSYRPPYERPDGTSVIDPRPGPVTAEILARYAPHAPPVTHPPTDQASWLAWLTGLNLDPRPTRARADWAGVPRLLLLPTGPQLVAAQFDASARDGTGWHRQTRTEYTVFDPAHGVCLQVEISMIDAPALDLHGAREARW